MECVLYGNEYAVVFLYYTLEIEFARIMAEGLLLFMADTIFGVCVIYYCVNHRLALRDEEIYISY